MEIRSCFDSRKVLCLQFLDFRKQASLILFAFLLLAFFFTFLTAATPWWQQLTLIFWYCLYGTKDLQTLYFKIFSGGRQEQALDEFVVLVNLVLNSIYWFVLMLNSMWHQRMRSLFVAVALLMIGEITSNCERLSWYCWLPQLNDLWYKQATIKCVGNSFITNWVEIKIYCLMTIFKSNSRKKAICTFTKG